jgi:hypothetical protein
MELTHKFYWGNTAERAARKGQMCRIVGQVGWDVCIVEFADGHQMTVPKRSIRRSVHSIRQIAARSKGRIK